MRFQPWVDSQELKLLPSQKNVWDLGIEGFATKRDSFLAKKTSLHGAVKVLNLLAID